MEGESSTAKATAKASKDKTTADSAADTTSGKATAEKVKVDPLIFWVSFGFIVAFVSAAIIWVKGQKVCPESRIFTD